MYLQHEDTKTAAIAHALLVAASHAFEVDEELNARHAEAANASRKLSQDLQAWSELLEPLIEYNRRRNEKYGEHAKIFTASEIPERVAKLAREFHELAQVVAEQLHSGAADARGQGRPPGELLNTLTEILRDGARGRSADRGRR